MGMFLNPDDQQLRDDRCQPFYVDKSLIIREMNNIVRQKSDKFICVSRPRRFGKTMAANMIAAYYSKGCNSHEIFSDLKISKDPSFEEQINIRSSNWI